MTKRERAPVRERTLGTTGTTSFGRRQSAAATDFAILGAAALTQSAVQRARLDLETQVTERVRADFEQLQVRVAALEDHLGRISNRSRLVALASLGHESLRLRAPLYVELESGDDSVSASCTELETYGVGDSDPEALDDLRRAVVSDFLFLTENEARLGPDPKRLLGIFRERIEVLA